MTKPTKKTVKQWDKSLADAKPACPAPLAMFAERVFATAAACSLNHDDARMVLDMRSEDWWQVADGVSFLLKSLGK